MPRKTSPPNVSVGSACSRSSRSVSWITARRPRSDVDAVQQLVDCGQHLVDAPLLDQLRGNLIFQQALTCEEPQTRSDEGVPGKMFSVIEALYIDIRAAN